MSRFREDIQIDKHVAYFSDFLKNVGAEYQSLDVSRMMVLYFALSALDILDQIKGNGNQGTHSSADVADFQRSADSVGFRSHETRGSVISESRRLEIIDWVYSQQVRLTDANGEFCGGFIGGGFCGSMEKPENVTKFHQAHLSMTYCALLILAILGDDYSRVDKKAIIRGIRHLQQPDGNFQPSASSTESDMRFVFCATAICFMLQDWTGMNIDRTAQFIGSSQSYDGGFSILAGMETHAGYIYTAISSLKLMGRLDVLTCKENLEMFLISRQSAEGYNGRLNKAPDCCYSFWVQASLLGLGLKRICNEDFTRSFILSCQTPFGGFSKHPVNQENQYPDIFHSYYAICGLSLSGEPGFLPIDNLGITLRACKSSAFADGNNSSQGKYFVNVEVPA